MRSVESKLKHKIERFFGIQRQEIDEFEDLGGSNWVYSFIVKEQKYVIKKLDDSSIVNWEQEKEAYDSLKPYNITDELLYYENGIKIAKFISNSETLSYSESDMIDALDKIRMIHESGVSIKHKYDIIENIDKHILRCDKNSKKLNELMKYKNKIDTIQTMLNKLNIPLVLCHGDACASTNFLRLSDGSIKIIDWEQAGMADPLLDIAISAIHQGFHYVDPVWCLHHYLKRIPEKQEFFRLFAFLALDSFAWTAWCIYADQEDYEQYLDYAIKYSNLVLNYY
jgi:thiamine kinase-like enzyme